MSFLDGLTNKETYSRILNNTANGSTSININGSNIKVENGKRPATDVFNKFTDSIDKSINISKYTAPTKLAIQSFNDMGSEIDKTLKDVMLLQVFHIKGTDILCAAFCFLISMLSCKERNALYDALKEADKATQAVRSGISAINQMVNTSGAIFANVDAIKSSANSLFGKGEDVGPNKIQAATTLVAAPMAIAGAAEKIITMLSLGTQFKMLAPDILGKGIWDLAAMILGMLQHQAIQMADEALNKLIQPVEDMINDLTPSICFGTMATRLQRQIITTIKEFKSRILSEIGQAISSNYDFNAKFRMQIKHSATTLQLLAFATALRTISSNFLEIARSCGLSPCRGGEAFRLDDIGNLDDWWIDNHASAMPNYFSDMRTYPNVTPQMDMLAGRLINDLQLNGGKTYVTPQEVLGVYNIADNAPSKILDLINNGALNNILDDNYSIYSASTGINVVYKFKKDCSNS